jgi:hypothetical protein
LEFKWGEQLKQVQVKVLELSKIIHDTQGFSIGKWLTPITISHSLDFYQEEGKYDLQKKN